MRLPVALALILAFCGGAFADPVPTKIRSGAYVAMIAEKGLDCGLLASWESLSLRALSLEDRKGWSEADLAVLKSETARMLAETGCTSETLTVWIEGSRKGFESEMLPPYLVAYRALAGLEPPPRVFEATALRLDKAPVIAAIDAKLAELEASGRPAEGGKSWPEYVDDTSQAVLEFAENLESEGGDQAAAWIAQSARIVETWYTETAE